MSIVFNDDRINMVITRMEEDYSIHNIMVVCGNNCRKLPIASEIEELEFPVVWFNDFTPNPEYESVEKGVKAFNDNKCEALIAIGGGSAMDVAKCIALFADMDSDRNYLEQLKENSDNCKAKPIIAVPTTAGTGSEATRFAVIYCDGMKQSVTHNSIIPEYVLMRPDLLKELPVYQRKATALDALCHAIESMWSVNSTEESKDYSKAAIKMTLENIKGYVNGDEKASKEMLMASNIAGKAINITQTTAGHAMCYRLTHLYGISHGHAAALCVEVLWPYMEEHLDETSDARGQEYLKGVFMELDDLFKGNAFAKFSDLLKDLEMEKPKLRNDEEIPMLVDSVNEGRLKNNPIFLDKNAIELLYKRIFMVHL